MGCYDIVEPEYLYKGEYNEALTMAEKCNKGCRKIRLRSLDKRRISNRMGQMTHQHQSW